MAQWPGPYPQIQRVVDHWVRGCDVDPMRALFSIQGGLRLTKQNNFWVADVLASGVPVEFVTATTGAFTPPEALIDMGVYLAWHDPARFYEAAHLVEMHRHSNIFWKSLFGAFAHATALPPLVSEVYHAVYHPKLRKFLWNVGVNIAEDMDVQSVCDKIGGVVAHPLPICSAEEHATMVAVAKRTGVTLTRTSSRHIASLQYTGVGVSMTKTDHLLIVLVAAFGENIPHLPPPVQELRAWLKRHRAENTRSTMQQILCDLRLGHTLTENEVWT